MREEDSLASLEQRIVRTVELVAALRRQNEEAIAERDRAQQSEIEARAEVDELRREVEELRGERRQVRARIEKLLGQMEQLESA
jgi:FtsZ-binding cell division protein ZapB